MHNCLKFEIYYYKFVADKPNILLMLGSNIIHFANSALEK